MNYRHAFHAGNFADVHKHIVLTLVLRRLLEKPTPFRVIDTHAGGGLYDLESEEPVRGGEWQGGIGRLAAATFPPAVEAKLAPYRAAVARANPDGGLRFYPGSPLIARAMLRADDRLIGCELEPGAAAALLANLGRGKRSKAIAIDGWTALSAYVPPLERRGLVLIDPPYEKTDEFARLADALRAAHCKWPTGLYLAWYPIKSDRAGPRMLAAALQDAGIDRLLWSEMTFGATQETGRLLGSGLVLVNPPWRLDEDLDEVLPHVAAALDDGRRLKVRTHR